MTIYEHLRNNVGINELEHLINDEAINWKRDKKICEQCEEDCGGECPFEDRCPFVDSPALLDVLLASDYEQFNFYTFLKKYEGGI